MSAAPWAKKAAAPWASSAKSASTSAPSLRDLQSEALAAKLSEPETPAHTHDDFALALRLQQEEGGLPIPSTILRQDSGRSAPPTDAISAIAASSSAVPTSSSEDDDLVLAMVLQEEEDRLAAQSGASLRAPVSVAYGALPRHSAVSILSQDDHQMRQALWASRAGARTRTLLSEADAVAGPSGAPSGRPLISTMGEAHDLAAALRENSEEALYQSLKGSGRRAGYLSLGPEDAADARDYSAAGSGGGASATGVRANISALGADGFVTKHDSYLSGRRNARALERRMGPSAGDLRHVTVSQAAVGGLQRFVARQSVKGVAAHGRVESEAHATSEGVLDSRTRHILFRLLGSGRCDAISGSVSTGKEASILLACNWHPEVHEELTRVDPLHEGWASQKSRVWEAQEEEDEEEGEEEGDLEEAGGDTDDGPGTGAADESSAAAGLIGRIDVRQRAQADTAGAGNASTQAGDADDGGNDGDDEDGVRPPGGDRAAHHGVNKDGSVDVALKIFKLSLNEFRDRKRYMDGDRRYARMELKRLNPRKIVTAWAEKEFKNLVRIHRAGIPSPAPLLLDGHVIAMSFIGSDGWPAPQLRSAQLSRPGWASAYRQVVAVMRALYAWTHLVHADLSEYNLLYEPVSKRVHVIDVGQAVDVSHPLALEFLESDATNVTTFFQRKGVDVLPLEELLALVTDPLLVPHPPSSAHRTGSHAGTVPAAGSGAKRDADMDDGTAAGSIICEPRGESEAQGTGASRDAHGQRDADDDHGPPGVTIVDFDLDQLFSGKAGAVVQAVNSRLAASAAQAQEDDRDE